MGIKQHFTDHPSSVDETYVEHMRVALSVSRQLAVASGQAVVHAFLPWVCCTSASAKITELHEMITSGARGERLAERERAEALVAD